MSYKQLVASKKESSPFTKYPGMKKFQNNLRKFGSFMAGMIMPIIGVIIAWGFFTAIILAAKTIIAVNNNIPINQWNSTHSKQYLFNMDYIIGWGISSVIPLMVGFFAGKQIYKTKGAIIGLISAMGIIGGSYSPIFNQIMVAITNNPALKDTSPPVMILGVMIASPIWAWVFKKTEKLYENKIPSGYEMLINNLSVGLFGLVALFINFWTLANVASVLQAIFYIIINGLNNHKLLWLMPIFIETEKVLFLNNAVNHGILGPLGYSEAAGPAGQSALFYLDPNPGQGMGLLLAYFMFGNKNEKAQSSAAMPVHFIGGIHEVYYPFILTKPLNLLWMIAGGIFAAVIYQIMNVGGVFTPSPGSIIMNYLALKPVPMNYAGLSVAIFGALIITCSLTSLTLILEKISKGERVYFNPIIANKVSLANRWSLALDIKSINKKTPIESINYSYGKSLGTYEWEIVKYDDGTVSYFILEKENKKINEFWYVWLSKSDTKLLKKFIKISNENPINEKISNEILEILNNSKEKREGAKRYLLKHTFNNKLKLVKVVSSDSIIESITYEKHDFVEKFRTLNFKSKMDKNQNEYFPKPLQQKVFFLTKEETLDDLNTEKEAVLIVDNDDSKNEIIKNAKKIIFACEAGMGSSAMGAGIVRKMLKEEGINLTVTNYAIKDIPPNATVIICQHMFKELVSSNFPNAYVYTIEQFLKKSEYSQLINEIKAVKKDNNDN